MKWRAAIRSCSGESEEAGATLVEVLVASVLMAGAVIVLVTGMGALFATASHNRQSTTASVVARSYGESLELAVAREGAWCHPTYTVDYTPPTGYSVDASYSACPGNGAAQFQNATVTVTAPNGSQELLHMVVRRP